MGHETGKPFLLGHATDRDNPGTDRAARRLFGVRLGFFNFAALSWVGLSLLILRPILILGLLVLILRRSLLGGLCILPGAPSLRLLGRRLSRMIQIGPQLPGRRRAVQMQVDLVALNGLDLPAGDPGNSIQGSASTRTVVTLRCLNESKCGYLWWGRLGGPVFPTL